jgi:hypothetical protein
MDNIHIRFISTIVKGIILSLLYFEITKANDTTFNNVFYFTFFYTVMIYGSILLGIESNLVTNAFITKTVFTLIDQRIQRKTEQFKNKN